MLAPDDRSRPRKGRRSKTKEKCASMQHVQHEDRSRNTHKNRTSRVTSHPMPILLAGQHTRTMIKQDTLLPAVPHIDLISNPKLTQIDEANKSTTVLDRSMYVETNPDEGIWWRRTGRGRGRGRRTAMSMHTTRFFPFDSNPLFVCFSLSSWNIKFLATRNRRNC